MARGYDLEVEQRIRDEIRAEKAQAEAVEQERAHKEQVASEQRAHALSVSCWCGLNHESGESLHGGRENPHGIWTIDETSANRGLFVMNISFAMEYREVPKVLTSILRAGGVRTDHLAFYPGTKVEYWGAESHKVFTGTCKIACPNADRAIEVAKCLHGHETLRRGRRKARELLFHKVRRLILRRPQNVQPAASRLLHQDCCPISKESKCAHMVSHSLAV